MHAERAAAQRCFPGIEVGGDTEDLRAELITARERGYAFNGRELDPGLRTADLPILDSQGRCRFALGMRGPATLMIDERVPFFVELAKVTAAHIAARFAAG